MISLLLGTHLFFTFRLKGIQFHITKQFKALFMHKKHDTGEISQFSSLMSILASTMGTGNIIGVATALILGGAGSVFWMAFAGILGMATKYAETWLAVKHRRHLHDGTFLGGAMIVLKDKHPFMAGLFCLFGAFAALGMGCSIQSNAAALMLKNTLDIPLVLSAVLFSALTFFIIFRGMKGIASLCSVLIPFVGTIYFSACIAIIIINHQFILPALQQIFTSAFSTQSMLSGFFASSISNAIRYGISRGLFTNEAGMGSTPLFSASAASSDPQTPSYLAMMSVFLDTVIICSLTGIVFVSCSIRYPELSLITSAEDLSLACFSILPVLGRYILCISIVLFALSTIFSWCIISERLLL